MHMLVSVGVHILSKRFSNKKMRLDENRLTHLKQNNPVTAINGHYLAEKYIISGLETKCCFNLSASSQ